MTDLEQMRQWQAAAATHLAAGGQSAGDEFGCKLGIQDALKEEVLLMLEAMCKTQHAKRDLGDTITGQPVGKGAV